MYEKVIELGTLGIWIFDDVQIHAWLTSDGRLSTLRPGSNNDTGNIGD